MDRSGGHPTESRSARVGHGPDLARNDQRLLPMHRSSGEFCRRPYGIPRSSRYLVEEGSL
jgi:hypothetical protein